MMPEVRRLITTGPYAIVRHPMYLSEQIAIAGIVLQNFSLYALALFTVHFWIQVQRMKHEENVLRNTFSEYDEVMGSRAPSYSLRLLKPAESSNLGLVGECVVLLSLTPQS